MKRNTYLWSTSFVSGFMILAVCLILSHRRAFSSSDNTPEAAGTLSGREMETIRFHLKQCQLSLLQAVDGCWSRNGKDALSPHRALSVLYDISFMQERLNLISKELRSHIENSGILTKDYYFALYAESRSIASDTIPERKGWAEEEVRASERLGELGIFGSNELCRIFIEERKTTEALNLFASLVIETFKENPKRKIEFVRRSKGLPSIFTPPPEISDVPSVFMTLRRVLGPSYRALKESGILDETIWSTLEAAWRNDDSWDQEFYQAFEKVVKQTWKELPPEEFARMRVEREATAFFPDQVSTRTVQFLKDLLRER